MTGPGRWFGQIVGEKSEDGSDRARNEEPVDGSGFDAVSAESGLGRMQTT